MNLGGAAALGIGAVAGGLAPQAIDWMAWNDPAREVELDFERVEREARFWPEPPVFERQVPDEEDKDSDTQWGWPMWAEDIMDPLFLGGGGMGGVASGVTGA